MNINKRRGYIKVDNTSELFNNSKAMEALFSKFYPTAIVPEHDFGFNSVLKYFGYSPLFKEIDETEPTPKYDFIFKTEFICENIVVSISECCEIKQENEIY